MRRITSIKAINAVNFTVGFALLVMLFPVAGKPLEKPAGVRTAIEAVSKKQSLPGNLSGLIAH